MGDGGGTHVDGKPEYRAFEQRSLADRDYVYVRVDGVHFNVRLEDDRLCTLVMIGVRPDGSKELIAVADGYRAGIRFIDGVQQLGTRAKPRRRAA